MNRLSSLPRDISVTSMLPYISPSDFDTYCSWLVSASRDSSPELVSWCSDPTNIRTYLAAHNLLFSDPNEGLMKVLGHSNILSDYFFSLGATALNVFMAKAAEDGNMQAAYTVSDLGARDYDFGLAYAAKGGHLDMVDFMLEHGATDIHKALDYATRAGQTDIVNFLSSLRI